MFENNESATSEARARSPAGSVTSDGEGQQLNQDLLTEGSSPAPQKTGNVEGSFSPSVDHELAALAGNKAKDSSEVVEHKELTSAKFAAVEATIEGEPEVTRKVLMISDKKMGTRVDGEVNGLKDSVIADKDEEMPGDNPDRIVSAVQDPEAVMKHSDPKDKEAVSGGAGLPPPTEPLSETPISSNTQQGSPAARKTPSSKFPEKDAGRMVSLATRNGSKPGSAAKTPLSTRKASPTKSTPTASPAISSSRNPSLKKDISPQLTSSSEAPVTLTKNVSAQSQATLASTSGAAAMDGTLSTSTDAAAPNGSSSPLATWSANNPSDTTTRRTSLTAPKAASLSRSSNPRLSSASIASTASKKPRTSPPMKPRRKSPTRPVCLSSHLTAPTASSAAKHSRPRATSSTAAAPANVARKLSTLHLDRLAAPRAAAPTASHAPKQSTRTSLTKPKRVKRPDSRNGTATATATGPTRKEPTMPAGQSFLDRVTRPTASSSSKAHEKIEAGKAREGI